MGTAMKRCAKCGRLLPTSDYYAKGNGLQSWCKDCCKAHGRLRNGTTGKYRTPEKESSETMGTSPKHQQLNLNFEGTMNEKEVKTISLMEDAHTGDNVVSFVYETNDYNKFVTFRENREPDHVGRIVSNMLEYGAIQKPIVCTIHRDYPGKLVIVDGNNSFNARIQLGKPIPYIVLNEATPREMTALNLVSKNWTNRNYIDLYASLGYSDYLIYQNLLKEYDFSCRSLEYILRLSTTNDSSVRGHGNAHHAVARGLFKCKDTKRSLEIIDFLMKIKKIENGRSIIYKADYFVAAIVRLFNYSQFEPERLLKKMESFPFFISKQADATGYLEMVEKIYNHRQKPEYVVKFDSIKFNK